MANKKISALTAATTLATGDLMPIVDISDTTDAATGTTKKTTIANMSASGSEVDTGTSEIKFVTPKSLADSTYVPTVAPGTSGNVLKSNGTDWTSASSPSVEIEVAASHSLATTAGQTVIVFAKGDYSAGAASVVTLKYGGVTKDTLNLGDTGGGKTGFSLMYTETPGAVTANVTVETTAGSIANVVIMVVKLN